jgi:hypothetical protein
MAAALSPSTEPKLPWPVDERVAQRERLRHAHERVVDGEVAVGVVSPITSPTTRAHFTYGRFQTLLASCIAYSTRRCTGLRPSRTSGSARPTITLIA